MRLIVTGMILVPGLVRPTLLVYARRWNIFKLHVFTALGESGRLFTISLGIATPSEKLWDGLLQCLCVYAKSEIACFSCRVQVLFDWKYFFGVGDYVRSMSQHLDDRKNS
jgi:hypothetical protein